MGVLNVRVDPKTAALVEQIANETGRSKSEVVRDALKALGGRGARRALSPAESMAHLIGSWDSGGMRLSERTGESFARILREKIHGRRTHGRRTAGRAD